MSADRTLTNIEQFFDRSGDIWIGAYQSGDADWDKHWEFRQREGHACQLLENEPRGTALDLGCGAGNALVRLKRMGFERVLGVDISERMVTEARAAAEKAGFGSEIDVQQGDVRNLSDVADESVDACIALGVIEYLDTDADLLSEVRRILRPGGAAVIQTRNKYCFATQTREALVAAMPRLRRDPTMIDYRFHRPRDLRQSADEQGLVVEVERFSHYHALFPLELVPSIRNALEGVDRRVNQYFERFADRRASQWFASMYIAKLRKPAALPPASS